MTYRLTTIYTRKGDEGYTSLGNQLLSKDDLLIEALGTVDELNANIGLIIAFGFQNSEIRQCLSAVQQNLFNLGGELHLPERIAITAETVTQLEKDLDSWNQTLPPLKDFVLPRGTPAAAACHISRTVCRRAERCMVRWHRQIPLNNPEILRYLNRLSDLLFVISRVLAKEGKEDEVLWEHE